MNAEFWWRGLASAAAALAASPWAFVALATLLAAAFGASLAHACKHDGGGQAPGDAGTHDGIHDGTHDNAHNDAKDSASPRPSRTGRWLLLAAAPLALATLYAGWGNPSAIAAAAAARDPQAGKLALEGMVAGLAARLQTEGGSDAEWIMLGRSHQVMGQPAQAAAAFERAAVTARQDVEVLTLWIEARSLAAGGQFDGRSRELLAHAISLAPEHPGVLLLRGLAALERGDHGAARQSLLKLRERYPPGSADHEALGRALQRIERGQAPRQAGAPNVPNVPNVPKATTATPAAMRPAAAAAAAEGANASQLR